MSTRRPIFSRRRSNETIGYINGDNAYDLAGKLRCRYDEASGNLLDLATGKVIGHISLESYFVGLSWIADELFSASAEASAPLASSPEALVPDQSDKPETAASAEAPAPLMTSSEASTAEQSDKPETEPSVSVDADVERALENLRMVLRTK